MGYIKLVGPGGTDTEDIKLGSIGHKVIKISGTITSKRGDTVAADAILHGGDTLTLTGTASIELEF